MPFDVEAVRKDFPSLEQQVKGRAPVYFDNACMTLKPRQVVEAMNEYYFKHPSCHNRAVHAFGERTTQRYNQARKATADFIGAGSAEELIFTRNTTEGINLVANSFKLSKGDVVLTTDMEHNSNLLPWQQLVQKRGIVHTIVPFQDDFSLDLELLESKLKQGVKLVSMVHTSHVTGHTIRAAEIIGLAHRYSAKVLLDCAQSASHHVLNVRELDVDFLTFSFHKILGPTGMGALYVKEDIMEDLDPFLVGGETVHDVEYHSCVFSAGPERFEAGLQNYAGAMGAQAALRYLTDLGIEKVHRHLVKLNRIITEGIIALPRIRLIGPPAPEDRAGIVNFSVEGMDCGELSILLDSTKSIMTRSGVHCCHSWYHKQELGPTLRASLYAYNTGEEAELFVQTIKDMASYF